MTANQQSMTPFNQVTMVAIPSNNTANFSRPPPTQPTHLAQLQQTTIPANVSQGQGFIPASLLRQNFYVAPTTALMPRNNTANGIVNGSNNEFTTLKCMFV